MVEPVDIRRALSDPDTYEAAIMRVFDKRRQRGQAFDEADRGVTYFDAASDRHSLARAIAHSVADGTYRPGPVELWILETKGKQRAAHMPAFVDHVVGSAFYQLLSRNARCYGLPGVYSYLPGLTNVSAIRDLAAFVRAHRKRLGDKAPPLYVLQSDFEHYGDNLPVGPDSALWPIVREVVSLGSPGGDVDPDTWDLLTALARPVVVDEDGTQFTRLHGVAMGTPLVPMLANLAVVPMDRAVLGIEGIFYARYNDDFLLAHPDLSALREADALIDSLLTGLGVRRKPAKEIRTALGATGLPASGDPAYRGRNRIDYLGLSVSHAGTTSVAPHRQQRFIARVADRIDGAAAGLSTLPVGDRARHLVAVVNTMLDAKSPFAIPGLPALLDSTTDRGVLKDLDFRIARKIAQVATGRAGVHGFRLVPPGTLRGEMGLVSMVQVRNLR